MYDSTGLLYSLGYFNDTLTVEGEKFVSRGAEDIILVKYDTTGVVIWKKQLGGPNREIAHDLAIDPAGNLYLTGYFTGSGDFEGTTLSTIPWDFGNAFVVKINKHGNLEWAKNIGVAQVNLAEAGRSIAVDTHGNSYVTGLYGRDLFVAKLSADGRVLWMRRGGGNSSRVGSDIGIDIVADASGNRLRVRLFLGSRDAWVGIS